MRTRAPTGTFRELLGDEEQTMSSFQHGSAETDTGHRYSWSDWQLGGLPPAAPWLLTAAITRLWADKSDSDWALTAGLSAIIIVFASGLALAVVSRRRRGRIGAQLRRAAPWQLLLAVFAAVRG